MDDRGRRFLGLEPTDSPERWRLPISNHICGGTGFLHGGCALAATVAAMEAATERPVAWATAQYLARVRPPDVVDIDVNVLASGRANTQASATICAGDRVIATTMATLGGRDLGLDRTWAQPPEVAPPEACEPRTRPESGIQDSFTGRADIRIAHARLGDPQATYWCRLADGVHGTAVGMAALGDLLPSGLRMAAGMEMRGSSLDNSVRILREADTDWILVDTTSDGFGPSIGHGHVRFFSREGQLLGTGGQSFSPTALHPETEVHP